MGIAPSNTVASTTAYDIYQHRMDYWATTLQDDADLVPATILVAKYFALERAAIDALDNLLATLE